ncbi:hypothetical protein V8G54_001332 [Vigna mungo]|uniref:Uncharacterized protein n=1 Tax=Vigna mungo TaxID=3915 RepID=A0AAQ3SAW7_VIGMU
MRTKLKKRIEKDIDKVGKIAHGVKTKIEAINRDTLIYWLNINLSNRQKPGCEKGTCKNEYDKRVAIANRSVGGGVIIVLAEKEKEEKEMDIAKLEFDFMGT